MTTKIVTYLRVEDIERPYVRRTKRGPQVSMKWVPGYSRLLPTGQRTYPAVTKREARAECARAGETPRFWAVDPASEVQS